MKENSPVPSAVPRYVAGALFLLTLVFLAAPAAAVDYPPESYFTHTCADANTTHYSTAVTITDCNQTECEYDVVYNKACLNGCSNTLGQCRGDSLTEALYFIGLILFLCVGLYVAWQFEAAGVVLSLLIFIVAVGLNVIDAFSARYDIFIRLLPFALLGFMATRYWVGGNRDKQAAAKRGQGEESRGEGE